MKKLFKKLLAVIMVVVMTLTAAPLSGFVGLELPSLFDFKADAAKTYSGTCGDNLTWSLDTNTGVLEISGTGEMTDFSYTSIPWHQYRSYIKSATISDGVTNISYCAFYYCESLISITIPDSVIGIGNYAFSGCKSLASISIPDNITTIGDNAFSYCDSLTSITIPEGVKTIGEQAFSSCDSLASVTIPDSIMNIGNYAFYWCDSLVNITIPNKVTSIGDYAFTECDSLTTINIPNSVVSIGDYAFSGCDSLKSIKVSIDNNHYSSDSCGVLFNKLKTELVQYPIGNERTSYTIPNSVITIGSEAFFYSQNLNSITIPNSVTSIGDGVFRWCDSLNSILIPDSVTSIGNEAFESCDILTDITIPSSVTSIGDKAFANCEKLVSVMFKNGVKVIGQHAFTDCEKITSVYIPQSVEYIGNGCFDGCRSLKTIEVDKNNRNYSSDEYGVLFNFDKTTILRYPCGNERKSYIFPDSVVEIQGAVCEKFAGFTLISSYGAFGGASNLSRIKINSKIQTIDSYDFAFCDALESVWFPLSVIQVNEYAFYSSENLKNIYYIGSELQWKNVSVSDNNTELFDATIHYNSSQQLEDNYGLNIPEDIVFIDKDEHYLFSAYDKNGNDITDKADWSSTTSVDCTGEVKITNKGDVLGVKQGLTNLHASYWDKETLENLGDDSCYVFVGEPNEVKYTSVSDQIYYYGENAFYSDAADFSDSVDIYLSLENALNEQIDDLTEYDKYADELSALDIKGYTLTAKVSGSNLSFNKDKYSNNYVSAVDGKIPVGKAVDELLTLYPYNLDVDSADKSFTVTIQIESDDFDTITDSFTFKISSLEDKEINEHIGFINTNGVYKAMRDDDFATNMTELKSEDQYILAKYFSLDFENYYEVVMADVLVQLMETQLVGNISLLPVLKEWKSNYDTILSCVSTIVEDSYAGSMEIADNLIDKVIKKSKYTTEGMDVHDEVRDLVVLKLRDTVSIDKINSAFAVLDKTGQCLDLFDMGVNIRNDIADFVDCVSIMNSYQDMNDEFKNVIQKVYDCIPDSDRQVKEAVNHYVKLDTTAGYTQEVIESVIGLSKDITLEVFNSVFKKQFVSMFTKAVGTITLKSGALLSSTTWFSPVSTGLGAISTGATLGLCISDILCNNSGQAAEMGKVVAASQLAPYVIQTLKYYEWALKTYKDESSLKHFETSFNLNRALQMYSIEHTYKALEVQANSLIIKLFSNKDYPGAMAELASLKTMHQNCNCCADVSTVVVRTKTIAIKCPVDVYVYDENGKEVVRIINDVAVYVEDGINVFINGREKYVTVPADQEYSVKIVAIDEGTMDYLVMEHDENGKYEVAFSNLNIELNSGKELRGKICDEFNVVEDAYKISVVFNDELKINKTSTTKINYGDTLVLTADVGGYTLPAGYTIEWLVEGAGVSTKVNDDGAECRVTSIAKGNATITARIVDENGEAITNADGEAISDEITITSKAGFWQKLVSFFKNLFGVNRVIY